jgi:ATP/ADP translocase
MCIYTEKILVRIVASDVMYFTIEELFSIIIGLVVLLFALSAMIAHLLRNLSKKKQVLE